MRTWGVEHNGKSGRHEFTEFYTSAADDCLRIVLVTVGDRQLAEDLVAEAFTRAWMSWRTVREHPVPRAWVVRTALNTHVSWWRRRRREVPLDPGNPAGPGTRTLEMLSRPLSMMIWRRPSVRCRDRVQPGQDRHEHPADLH